MNDAPASSIAEPPLNLPTRSLGPCRSNRIVVGRRSSFSSARIASTSVAFSAWLPWLMLIRKASAPASISLRIISGLLDAGPSVARIFTLRARGLSGSVTRLRGRARRHSGLRRDGSTGLRRGAGLA